MHETTDGFNVAEEDLRIRGPGEITGIRQSGYASFELADPIRDGDILEKARDAAFTFLTAELEGSPR
jgi:ATP-dependent DNA helicase RecG